MSNVNWNSEVAKKLTNTVLSVTSDMYNSVSALFNEASSLAEGSGKNSPPVLAVSKFSEQVVNQLKAVSETTEAVVNIFNKYGEAAEEAASTQEFDHIGV